MATNTFGAKKLSQPYFQDLSNVVKYTQYRAGLIILRLPLSFGAKNNDPAERVGGESGGRNFSTPHLSRNLPTPNLSSHIQISPAKSTIFKTGLGHYFQANIYLTPPSQPQAIRHKLRSCFNLGVQPRASIYDIINESLFSAVKRVYSR